MSLTARMHALKERGDDTYLDARARSGIGSSVAEEERARDWRAVELQPERGHRQGRSVGPAVPAQGHEAPKAKTRRGKKTRVTIEQVNECVSRGLSIPEMMEELDCCRGTINNKLRAAGIWLAGNKKNAQRGAPRTRVAKRHPSDDVLDRTATMPPINNPALVEGRTFFPSTVVDVRGQQNVLIQGVNSKKIGSSIIKGRWSGFPIYTLTLEERRTCPDSCALWRSCYGNNMHFAKRFRHGEQLEERLGAELTLLQYRHPGGFAVRLHVLGDFYSVRYVNAWAGFIEKHPALHVFGFTARCEASDPIARALIRLALDRGDRFCLRFSNAPVDEWTTVTVEHPRQVPADAVLCPQQLGKTDSCGTCALCWDTARRIAFLRH